MNAPERHKRYLLDEGEKRVEYSKDQKIPNAGTFTLNKEDHTLGNLLRMQLLRDPGVRFAGYKMPHPLENKCLIKIQTHDGANHNPIAAMKNAIDTLAAEFDHIDRCVREEIQKRKNAAGAEP